jgi:hypothetical protein
MRGEGKETTMLVAAERERLGGAIASLLSSSTCSVL